MAETSDPLDYFGEFGRLAPLLDVYERLRVQMLDADLVWHLPVDMLPGVTEAYGIPVVRYDGPPALAHVMTSRFEVP